jgi:hypothetical protein
MADAEKELPWQSLARSNPSSIKPSGLIKSSLPAKDDSD